MKKVAGLLLFSFVWIVASQYVFSQGNGHPPPPPCCTRTSSAKNPWPGFKPPVALLPGNPKSQLEASDQVLQVMGVTRSQFVERVAAAFFPDRPFDVLVSTTEWIDPSELELSGGPSKAHSNGVGGLVAVQIKRVYQIPGSALDPDCLENLDECIVTDGEVSVSIRFELGAAEGTGDSR